MDLLSEAKALLEQNRRSVKGFHFTVPSPDTYPYQWLWDSCFHAIVLSGIDPEMAKDELRALVSKQFPNGMIPHMIYWEPGTLHRYEWGKDGTSSITQPPLLTYAVWEIWKKTGDNAFLEEMYTPAYRFLTYLVSQRDPRDNHLIGIINPDESGEDNSPRFDGLLDAAADITSDEHLKKRMILIEQNRTCNFDAETCMKKFFWVKDVPFNAFAVESLKILAQMAKALGREDDVHFASLHAELIEEAMRARMFEDGVFWSARGEDYEKIKVKTWAMFVPMFAGLYTDEEARAVVDDYLLNPDEFLTSFSVPTVSRSERSFSTKGFWRGPVWLAPNWFIYKGLRRYGFIEEAGKVKESSLALLEKSGFREYFDSETGEGYGANDFTWGALALDME